MSDVKISVVTVVYNGERYIEETIISVLNQSYGNVEYVIIDGASTDNTINIINKYSGNINFFISESDNGLSDAMNKAVKHCNGEYVVFLHADDLFVGNDSLTDLANSVSGKSWATGFYLIIDSKGSEIRRDKYSTGTFRGMLMRNIIRHQSTIVKTEVVKEFPFNGKFKYAMDYDFFLRVWSKYGAPNFIHKHVAKFRLDGNNLSSDFIASIKSEMYVRVLWRLENYEFYKIPYDICVYFLRVLKIKLYHSKL